MRKITIMLLFTFTLYVYGKGQTPKLSKEDYLKKSASQKKTAWIMLGGGTALMLSAIVIPRGEEIGPTYFIKKYKNDGLKATIFLGGFLSSLGSIPFFISASKNKRRAGTAILFSNEKTYPGIHGTVAVKYQPTITFRTRLGF